MRLRLVYSDVCPFITHYNGAWDTIYNPYHRDWRWHNWNMWWGAVWDGQLEIVTA